MDLSLAQFDNGGWCGLINRMLFISFFNFHLFGLD